MVIEFLTGYGPTDGRCFSCLEASVRAVSLSPCFSRYNYKALSHFKIASLKFTFRGMSLVCNTGSNGYTRKPDSSSRSKHVFSQRKNQSNKDRDGSDSLQESKLFSSKNGSLSVPSAPKFQLNGTPEPREEESSANFFSKVKAQRQLRAVIKEEKKPEELQRDGDKDGEDARVVLDLLRKYSSPIGEACNSSSRDDLLDQSEQDGLFAKEKNMSSPRFAKKHNNLMGDKFSRNGSIRDLFLNASEVLDGSLGGKESTRSPKLAKKFGTPMGKKSISSSGDSSKGFLDHSKPDGLFDEEKSVRSPKLARKHIAQTGRISVSNGSSRNFLGQSEQVGVADEEKSTSSSESYNFGEQESPFIKLLNEHTIQKGKNRSSNGSSRNFILEHSVQNGVVNRRKDPTSVDSNDFVKHESHTLNRPVSNFRRRSPIPRVKFELIGTNSVTGSNLGDKRERTLLEHEKREDSSDSVVSCSQNEAEQKPTVEGDLRAMKLPELKALAKSRGMKGLSRLRKHELLELLGGAST